MMHGRSATRSSIASCSCARLYSVTGSPWSSDPGSLGGRYAASATALRVLGRDHQVDEVRVDRLVDAVVAAVAGVALAVVGHEVAVGQHARYEHRVVVGGGGVALVADHQDRR